MVTIYYNSYSLCTYETLWNGEAFLDTTVIPVLLMFVINLVVLIRKLRLSPLAFIRRDLTRKKKKRAFRLNRKIPFFHRFRIRIMLQNIPNYLTLFIGILLAAIVIVFGLMFEPLLKDYAVLVNESKLCAYQYILKTPEKTENTQAEPYFLTELETRHDGYLTDEISVYGIAVDSSYIIKEIPEGEVLVSEGILKKFGLQAGDTLTLKERYDEKTYDFVISDGYTYDAGLAVFMRQSDYLEQFHEDEASFTGYFSNELLSDLDEADVAAIVTEEDLTKMSRQLLVSMGDFMALFRYFGVLMFLLMMYLLSKQIIEKNAQSISMTKILGFTDGEIARLYIVATSIVVVVSLLLAVPIADGILRVMFQSYIYTEMTGYIPYLVSKQCFVTMVLLGIGSYLFVAVLQLYRIRKIPKSDALKNTGD
jgi:putative ABC transport system permease protein